MLNSMHGRNLWSILGRTASAVALAAGLAAFGGCRSGGSAEGADDQRASAVPVPHDEWASLGYRLDWRGFASVPPGNRVTSFQIGPDVLVVQENGTRVSVLEAQDGAIRWTNELANRLTRFTDARVQGDLVLATSETELIGLNLGTGHVTLRQRFPRVVNTPPMISGNVAVYGTASGEIVGHLLSNGVKLWGFQTPGSIEHGAVEVAGLAGVVSQSGDVVFLDPQSGTLYGRHSMFRGIESQPAAGDGAMYVASLDQSLYAFEPGGTVRWRYRTEHALEAQPTFHNGAVYLEVPRTGLVAIDARTGRQRWAAGEVRGTVVAERNGMLVVFSRGTVTLVDPADGTIVGRESIGAVDRLVADGFTDGALYAVSNSGTIARFIPRR
jgi:outer membrane protein assembly factor BamB